MTYGPFAGFLPPVLISEDWRPAHDGDEEGCAPGAGRQSAGHRVPLEALDRDIVESQTTPGTYYELFRHDDGWTCTCPGFQYRHDCKHVQRKLEEDHGH